MSGEPNITEASSPYDHGLLVATGSGDQYKLTIELWRDPRGGPQGYINTRDEYEHSRTTPFQTYAEAQAKIEELKGLLAQRGFSIEYHEHAAGTLVGEMAGPAQEGRALAAEPKLASPGPQLKATDPPSPDPGSRADTISPNNNRPDQVGNNQAGPASEPSNGDRPGLAKPETANRHPGSPVTGAAYAAVAGFTGGLLGSFIPDLTEFLGGLGFGYMDESDIADAMQEFRDFGEAATAAAIEEDETIGTAAAAVGAILPDFISPSSKMRAAGTGGKAGQYLSKLAVKKAKEAAAAGARKQLLKKLLKELENSPAFKTMKKRGLVEHPLKESRGSWFQKWLSGKDYEYVAKLKKPLDGTDTVQIDDLVVGANKKIAVIEAKFMAKYTEMLESGHFKFRKDKIGHLKRLVQYCEENKDVVSHIEITASKAEADQIYAELIAEIPYLKSYLDSGLITFGLP